MQFVDIEEIKHFHDFLLSIKKIKISTKVKKPTKWPNSIFLSIQNIKIKKHVA